MDGVSMVALGVLGMGVAGYVARKVRRDYEPDKDADVPKACAERDLIHQAIAAGRFAIMTARSPSRDVTYFYTVGFTGLGVPEFVIAGSSYEKAKATFDRFFDLATERALPLRRYHIRRSWKNGGERWTSLRSLTPEGRCVALLREPDRKRANLVGAPKACAYYGGYVRVLQVAYPDEKGAYPWEAECDPAFVAQQSELIDFAAEMKAAEEARVRAAATTIEAEKRKSDHDTSGHDWHNRTSIDTFDSNIAHDNAHHGHNF